VLGVTADVSAGGSASDSVVHPILLYDGVCGLCNRLVQFILRRDRDALFQFASLQSPFAAAILARHGANPAYLDTVYVVVNHNQPDESLRARSDAVRYVLRQLGGCWRFAGSLLTWLPRPLCDWGYRAVAHNRYRIFGSYDVCPLPSEDVRDRFLDL
jgi:predicted DCC family thiol-disulfide oxidoreductase YuxK